MTPEMKLRAIKSASPNVAKLMIEMWGMDVERWPKQDWSDDLKRSITEYTSHLNLAEKFYESCPFFYDRNNCFWLWKSDRSAYEMVDEIDILNVIGSGLKENSATVQSKIRGEILESLKRVGRLHIPKEMPSTWVQFRNCLYDVCNGTKQNPDPDYFCTNPVPWRLGDSQETPILDRILSEWVGSENIQTMKEIIAYCLIRDYPIHRMFVLLGSGSNGKSCFLSLLKKFLGSENCISSQLEVLVVSRFEGTKLYRKLACVLGETTDRMLQKTDIIKRLTGGDSIRGEFKNKPPFDFVNYAKVIIATNTLPPTQDKTDGFYRRPMIIDFPNKFTEEKDVLNTIPDQEYENLCFLCVNILQRLLKERKFTGEGTVEERRQKYEKHSNPTIIFLQDNYQKSFDSQVVFSDFYEELTAYLQESGYNKLTSKAVSKIMRNEGYEISKKTVDGQTTTYILGICLKNNSNTPNTYNSTQFSRVCGNKLKHGYFGYFGYSDIVQQLRTKYSYDPLASDDFVLEDARKLGRVLETTPGRFKLV